MGDVVSPLDTGRPTGRSGCGPDLETPLGVGRLTRDDVSEPVIRWTAQPVRRRPGRGIAAAAVILAAAVLARVLTGSVYWALFSGAVLFLSLEGFFLSTSYQLGAEGLEVRKAFSKNRSGWGTYRRVYEDKLGLTLSPYRRRTMLEPYRSVRLLYDGGDPREIRRVVREHVVPGTEWIAPDGTSEEIDGSDRTGQPASEGRASG